MRFADLLMVKVAVIVNAGAGSIGRSRTEERIREIRTALEIAGFEVTITLSEPANLTEAARGLTASEVDAVVAAGGDGTVSAVASGLVGTNMPLAVLPLGTRNHFARDLGMPLANLQAAARAIRHGVTRFIDVGEVNGRLFINNSSIGLYPDAVQVRNFEQRSTGRSRWLSTLLATSRVLRRFPLLQVWVTTPERSVMTKTPFLFVGNNEYSTGVLTLGRRPILDSGRLSLYTVRSRGRLHLLYLIGRALSGRVRSVRAFEFDRTTEATVRMNHRRRLRVAVDGELFRMRPPLHYRVRPRALRVITAGPHLRPAAPPADQSQNAAPGR